MIHVTPLGVGSALPSTTYHFSATVVELENQLFLFDCGEGTQVRFLEAGFNFSRLQAVFITHLHGDHYFGLPGLMSTMHLLNHPRELTVVGPTGLREYMTAMPARLSQREAAFSAKYLELASDVGREVFSSKSCRVVAEPLVHSVPAYGYRFEEKDRPGNLDVEKAQALGIYDYNDYRDLKEGRPVERPDGTLVEPGELVGPSHPGASFAYVTDSRPCDAGCRLARNADLLYHEATFLDIDRERAEHTMHATAREAAEVAAAAGAGKLLIGHFSARYDDAGSLVTEAREYFQNTEAAEELKRYSV